MTRRRTAHSRARSRTGSSGAGFQLYSTSRTQQPGGLQEEKRKRIYPEVHHVHTYDDSMRLIHLIEQDNIPKRLKMQRLLFMHALTFAPSFKEQFKPGELEETRKLFLDHARKFVENAPENNTLKRQYH